MGVRERFLLTLTGYRMRHGEWPTEVRLSRVAYGNLLGCFNPIEWQRIAAKLAVVEDEQAEVRVLRATGARGLSFDYWQDGIECFGPGLPTPEAWLGIERGGPPAELNDAACKAAIFEQADRLERAIKEWEVVVARSGERHDYAAYARERIRQLEAMLCGSAEPGTPADGGRDVGS